jgi:vancomycin resistance protein YoaR
MQLHWAGLSILERHPHSLNVKYVPNGQDAAVLYGSLDLKVQKRQIKPIRISTMITGQPADGYYSWQPGR